MNSAQNQLFGTRPFFLDLGTPEFYPRIYLKIYPRIYLRIYPRIYPRKKRSIFFVALRAALNTLFSTVFFACGADSIPDFFYPRIYPRIFKLWKFWGKLPQNFPEKLPQKPRIYLRIKKVCTNVIELQPCQPEPGSGHHINDLAAPRDRRGCLCKWWSSLSTESAL